MNDRTPVIRRVIIRTIGLQKEYLRREVRVAALRGVSLEIIQGEFLAIMGPSGSGKSTLFNLIGALDQASGGRVFIDEVDVAQLTAAELAYLRSRKIGYIFQTYNLLGSMTALENVVTPLVFAGVHPDDARRRGMELLGLVGLADRWRHRPAEMSGGQQQRVAIARALANRPAILLCDEPTANLDFKTGLEILGLLGTIHREQGVTIICATHDHRLLQMCDRLVWIRDGQVERQARRDELRITAGSVGGHAP